MKHPAFDAITRDTLIDWYRTGRERTRALFTIPAADAYYERPIALRNPIVFYEGHFPAFAVNTLIKLTRKERGIDPAFETLFARGIDPEDEAGVKDPASLWPSREAVQAYGREADALIERALLEAPEEQAEAVFTILEHEQMHHETFLYMLHNLPHARKHPRPPLNPAPTPDTRQPTANTWVRIPAGLATLGAPRGGAFGWDNEFPGFRTHVDAFEIERHNVTNGDYLAYIEATGAKAPHFWARIDGAWFWRGMFEMTPLPLDAPVYVSHDEAEAYAHWRGGRLPSEGEYDRAAYGDEAVPDPPQGNFDFACWDPVAVGSYPPSPWGVHDLAGNGWEWTSSVFDGFPGFEPMASYREYSADFFDGKHFVLKGGSQATARELIRRSFRNWFRPGYPYVYATFRCVR